MRRDGVGMRALFIVVRIVMAIAGVVAMGAQQFRSAQTWTAAGLTDHGPLWVNFFSFFTIDSNIAAVISFGIGAVLLILGRADPLWYARFRACAVTYMTVTLVVYNLLLRGVALPQGSTVEWANEILHVIAPLVLILDWFFAPGRRRLEWNTLWIVVAFPILWVIYSLIRGPLAYDFLNHRPTWYPYPFLNPDLSPEGYWSVLLYVILIAGAFVGTGAGVVRVSRTRERWPLPAA